MIVGFANFSDGKISKKPVGGQITTVHEKVIAERRYPLGSAADLITNHVRIILTGALGDPKGAVKGSFYAVCAFYQNDDFVGQSDPVTGQYAAGEARQDFNIICSFI